MIIRNYTAIDIKSIEKIAEDLHENYEFKLNEFTKCLVLEENKNIIGFITYAIIYETSEIIDIVIDKENRNKGYASKLLEKVIDDIMKNNCLNITLEVSVENSFAIKLYKKYGFEIVSTRKGYYNGVDAYLMNKKLR